MWKLSLSLYIVNDKYYCNHSSIAFGILLYFCISFDVELPHLTLASIRLSIAFSSRIPIIKLYRYLWLNKFCSSVKTTPRFYMNMWWAPKHAVSRNRIAFIYEPAIWASHVKTDFIARYIHCTHTHCKIVHSRHVVSTRVHGDKYRTFEVTISRTLLSNTYSHTGR